MPLVKIECQQAKGPRRACLDYTICACNGQKGMTFDNIKQELAGNEFAGEVEFLEPLKNNKEECAEKAKQWARKIIL